MSLHVNPLISVPGWMKEEWKREKVSKDRLEFKQRLMAWERTLDIYFTEKMKREELGSSSSLYYSPDCPDWISWRELVGTRLFKLEVGYLRMSLPPKTRGNLLPAICFSFAIWGEELLGGFGEEMEVFLTPCDHALIVEELSGFAEPSDDKEFYACLEVLTKEQRNCIAEFIEFYFGMYKSSFSWYTERSKAAADELVRIWRG